jgi:hypothetical protein
MADAVEIFHWFWIVVLILGIVIQIIFPWYQPIHLGIAISTIISQIIWRGCPLITLHHSLEIKYDPHASQYSGSFVYNKLKKIGITVPPIIIATQMLIVFIVSVVTMIIFWPLI